MSRLPRIFGGHRLLSCFGGSSRTSQDSGMDVAWHVDAQCVLGIAGMWYDIDDLVRGVCKEAGIACDVDVASGHEDVVSWWWRVSWEKSLK